MKRRSFLLLSSIAATSLLSGNATNTKPKNKINHQPLIIPPLLKGNNINGVYNYNLTIKKAKHEFFQNKFTDTYAINGTYLAPTLELINGQDVSINYTNELDEITTMHGHGMHLPANMDGSPHQNIKPNENWSAKYKVKQKACTNWYHPHAEGKTSEHVYKGLAGFIIIKDEESQNLDLPKEYGVDDIPLALQDRFFDTNAQLYYRPNMMQTMMGYNGNFFMSNGVLSPYVNVSAKEIRFRLLNGSNSTVYHLGFNDQRVFKQIATDNSFLEKPVLMNSLLLSPGERAEIVVDFTHAIDSSVYLYDMRQKKAFLKVNVTDKAKTISKTPSTLTTLEKYLPSDSVNTRRFTLSGRMGRVYINNKSMDMRRIDEIVPINKVEIWEIHNEKMMMMGMEHNFHIHGTHFMVLERNGSVENVSENEKGYKDTVYLAPGDSVKLIVKMTDYKSRSTPYMYHCHFLEHEDQGMMGQFLVV